MDVDEIIKKFDGLIDEDVASDVINKKLPKIDELKEGDSVGLYAKVLSVGKLKKLEKGHVKNVIIGDETGCCVLAIWGENAEMEIKEGDTIKILNGFVKQGFYGKEINVRERGEIRKSKKNIEAKECSQFITIDGTVEEKRDTRIHFINGKERFFKDVRIGKKWIVLIDEKIIEMKNVEVGMHVKIKWAYEKNGKIYVDDLGKITINN